MYRGKARVELTEPFIRMYEKQPREIRERAYRVLKELEENPLLGKPLRAEVKYGDTSYRFRSVRIGNYRLVYIYIPVTNTVMVYYIGHRKNIYKKLK